MESSYEDITACSQIDRAVHGKETSHNDSAACSQVAQQDSAALPHFADAVLNYEDAPADTVAHSHVVSADFDNEDAHVDPVALSPVLGAVVGNVDAHENAVALSRRDDADLGSDDAHDYSTARSHLVSAGLDTDGTRADSVACRVSTKEFVKPSTSLADRLRPLSITLQGNCAPKSQQNRYVQQLVAGASQALISKGFISIRQGIKVDGDKGASGVGPSQLSFPDPASALGFYLLFQDYHREATNCQCVVVHLANNKFQKELNDPRLKSRFAIPDAVTPGNVNEVLGI